MPASGPSSAASLRPLAARCYLRVAEGYHSDGWAKMFKVAAHCPPLLALVGFILRELACWEVS